MANEADKGDEGQSMRPQWCRGSHSDIMKAGDPEEVFRGQLNRSWGVTPKIETGMQTLMRLSMQVSHLNQQVNIERAITAIPICESKCRWRGDSRPKRNGNAGGGDDDELFGAGEIVGRRRMIRGGKDKTKRRKRFAWD